MIEEIKILLGDAAANYTDEQISIAFSMALTEVETYCKRCADDDLVLELCAQQIAVIKLNRMGTEGLASQSYSGVSENYLDAYPENIQMILRSKRKIKVVG